MEYLLVEKIAVDYWRLRRVLRFETGSIRENLDMTTYGYYHEQKHATNKELDIEIVEYRESLASNKAFIKCLIKDIVSFDEPYWKGDGKERDIEDDLWLLLSELKYKILRGDILEKFEYDELSFEEMKTALNDADYDDNDITKALITCLNKQNKKFLKKIDVLKHKKIKNNYAEEVNMMINCLPFSENAEKIMKYEKTIQKSILQNLAFLKRLQGF